MRITKSENQKDRQSQTAKATQSEKTRIVKIENKTLQNSRYNSSNDIQKRFETK